MDTCILSFAYPFSSKGEFRSQGECFLFNGRNFEFTPEQAERFYAKPQGMGWSIFKKASEETETIPLLKESIEDLAWEALKWFLKNGADLQEAIQQVLEWFYVRAREENTSAYPEMSLRPV